MKVYFIYLFVCLAVSLTQYTGVHSHHHLADAKEVVHNKAKLAKALATDYNNLIYPGYTSIKINLEFVCAQYDLTKKYLHTRVYERFSWTDWRLQWDPSKYGGIDEIKAPSDMIWKPHDIKLYNDFRESEEREDVLAIIESDGTVHWVPRTSYKTLCNPGESLNDRKVHCHISLGFWNYASQDIPIEIKAGGTSMQSYLDDCPHTMSNITTYIKNTEYPCCPGETYASLEVNFDLDIKHDLPTGRSRSGIKEKKQQRDGGISLGCRWPEC